MKLHRASVLDVTDTRSAQADKKSAICRPSGVVRLGIGLLGLWGAPTWANVVTDWNALANQCVTRAGPAALLDLALVQTAVHDAIQAIEQEFQPYLAAPTATGQESAAAAAAAAAYRVLSDSRICPDNFINPAAIDQPELDAAFAPYLAANDPGLVIGYAAADALLTQYRPGTTSIPLPYLGSTDIGAWRPTPTGNSPMAFVYLATTVPFTMLQAAQFRPQPPPPMQSEIYRREYDEVKQLGSIASHPATASCPAPDGTDKARFWSGNFVTQWNQTVRNIAIDEQLTLGDTARLLALANVAAADAAIAVWESKVHYNFWRPITAIREGDNDPHARTVGDPAWMPFIQSGHFPTGSQTPAYPDYVSGANGLTAAFVTTLQLFFGTDELSFAVNKATPAAVVICTNPRTFVRLSDAAQEVVDARILLGIHFRSADEEARRLGSRVAQWTFQKFLRPDAQ